MVRLLGLRLEMSLRDRDGCADWNRRREHSMTPDGVAPDLDCHRVTAGLTWSLVEAQGLADPDADRHRTADPRGELMRRVRIALDHVRDELLRAHASTVLTMGDLGRDPARMRDTLAEARSQHEALFHLRSAADALAATGRRRLSSGSPPEYRVAVTDWRGRKWL